jgi:hypothetical protein
VAEFKGSVPGAGILFAGGHHDTQAGTVGADDTGSGVAFILEMARILGKVKHKRTLRLISFGSEEQLSVGSAEYVRKHRSEIEKYGRFMFNVDSSGSVMGWTEINYNGSEKIIDAITPYFHGRDIYFSSSNDVVPYTDQFPFAACGVPGLWLFRRNCAAGRFFHHRSDEKIDRISTEILSKQVDAGAAFMCDLANSAKFPFKTGIPRKQADTIKKYWKDLFGGWKGSKLSGKK